MGLQLRTSSTSQRLASVSVSMSLGVVRMDSKYDLAGYFCVCVAQVAHVIVFTRIYDVFADTRHQNVVTLSTDQHVVSCSTEYFQNKSYMEIQAWLFLFFFALVRLCISREYEKVCR